MDQANSKRGGAELAQRERRQRGRGRHPRPHPANRRTVVRRARFQRRVGARARGRRAGQHRRHRLSLGQQGKIAVGGLRPPLRAADQGAAARARSLVPGCAARPGSRRSSKPSSARRCSRCRSRRALPSFACVPCCRARIPSCWRSWSLRISTSRAPRSSTSCAHVCRTSPGRTSAGGSTSSWAASTTPPPARTGSTPFSNGRCDPSDTEAVIKELVPFMTRAFHAPPTKPQRAARKRR